MINEGSKILNWPKQVIEKIKTLVTKGIKLFVNHNADNSTNGRKSVGEVVETFTKEVNGKLRSIAIACMSNEDAKQYDVCSIEAEIFEENGLVSGIKKITGIALGNSKSSTPAFANAKQMASIQCFETVLDEPKNNNVGSVKTMTMEEIKGEMMKLPKEVLVSVVKERNLFPHHIYNLDDLMNDKEFSPVVQKKIDLEKENETLKTSLSEKDNLLNGFARKEAENGAKDILTKLYPAGTTEKEKVFLSEMFDVKSLKEVTENEITGYIKEGKEKYQALAKKGFLKDEELKTNFDAGASVSGEDEEEKALNEAFE